MLWLSGFFLCVFFMGVGVGRLFVFVCCVFASLEMWRIKSSTISCSSKRQNKSKQHQMQKIQNLTARLTCKKRHDNVTPLLKKLHRLPVSEHIVCELATLLFGYFDGTLPPYLSCCLFSHSSSRSLHSSSQKLLTLPRASLKTLLHSLFSTRLHSFGIHYLWKSSSAPRCCLLNPN